MTAIILRSFKGLVFKSWDDSDVIVYNPASGDTHLISGRLKEIIRPFMFGEVVSCQEIRKIIEDSFPLLDNMSIDDYFNEIINELVYKKIIE